MCCQAWILRNAIKDDALHLRVCEQQMGLPRLGEVTIAIFFCLLLLLHWLARAGALLEFWSHGINVVACRPHPTTFKCVRPCNLPCSIFYGRRAIFYARRSTWSLPRPCSFIITRLDQMSRRDGYHWYVRLIETFFNSLLPLIKALWMDFSRLWSLIRVVTSCSSMGTTNLSSPFIELISLPERTLGLTFSWRPRS